MPRLAALLDLLILAEGFALLSVMLIGGFEVGWISATRATKPLLLLALMIPVRLTLPTPFLFYRPARQVGRRLSPALAIVQHKLPGATALVDVGLALLITRLAAYAIGFLANVLFPLRGPRSFAMPFRRARFAEIFAAWDSGWYFDIAKRGYYFNPDAQSSIAFFPLYPLLMRAAAWPFGGTDRAIWLAGIAISMTSFGAALLVLHRFTDRLCGDRETARRAVLYLAVFPFSFFFSRVYTESLFLLLSVLAIAEAHRGRWWWAGLWGALATVTRPNGILVGVPLVCFALAGRPNLRELLRRSVALALIPLGLATFCAYTYGLTGNPLAWLAAQRHWNYSLGDAPWRPFVRLIWGLERYGFYDFLLTSRFASFELIHGVTALLFLCLVPKVFQRLGPALGAYVLISLLPPLSASHLEGMGRYASVLFPIFILLARLRSAWFHEGLLVVCSLFRALFIALFVKLYPIY